MKPRILTTLLICSATLATTVTPAIAAVTPAANDTVQAPFANASSSSQEKQAAEENNIASTAFMDLGIKDGKFADFKSSNTWTPTGKPSIVTDAGMTGNILNFDGHSAYYTELTDDQQNKLRNGLTMEAYFKYDRGSNTSAEHEIFSSQERGGFGLGVQNGKIIFYAHDGSGYKQPAGELTAGKWVHAVGVIDKNKTAKLYLNGKLVDTVKMPGNLKFANKTKDLVLGGDAHPGNHVQSQMTGKVKSARLYTQTLTDNQVAQLSETAHKDQIVTAPVDQKVGTQFVGPKQVASGAIYGLNVHAKSLKLGDRENLSFDVVYDASKFEYENFDRTLGGKATNVEKVADGRLRITTTAEMSPQDFIYYAKTRLAHINLRAKKDASGQTQIKFEQTARKGTIELGAALNVDIQAQNPLDYNGDGIIGAGDVALAPDDKKAEVAAKSEIKPYKHVIVLTTDGGGNPWNPEGMYYDRGIGLGPVWTTNPEILAKRKNTYTMDLFNNKFAMSTSARSVDPAISAQNYISMLHGRPWNTLPKEYQGDNGSMGQKYFADFGKTTPQFPSVFKILQQYNPTQKAAAFSEWGPIANSIVEPDAAVTTKVSGGLKSFDDVADYIGTDDFQNTSMLYMQSDYMDGQGHGKGWYNDNYWNQYLKYDQLFKKVMDKLEATGHSHDTLVIANADHGGARRSHGGWDHTNSDIFIAMGGETVNSGHRLHGGSNADITALALNALQVPTVSSMENKEVFDKSAFLNQAELTKKNRDVETVELSRHGATAKIGMKNLKGNPIKAVDMQIDLAGHTVKNIHAVKGAKIVRKTVENGVLKLTVSSDKGLSKEFVKINFKHSLKANKAKVSVNQAMAATDKGAEVLVDLSNVDRSIKPGSNISHKVKDVINNVINLVTHKRGK